MKIKKAFETCKKQGMIYIFRNEYDEQYLSDGVAVYPVFDLPKLNEDYICRLYDITDSQRNKIEFNIFERLPAMDLSDVTDSETPAAIWDISLIYNGANIIPITTDEGVMFINQLYLKPFTDMPQNEMQITKRVDESSTPYFCIKFGMVAYGFIYPIQVVNKEFVKKIQSLYEQSKIVLLNQRSSDNETI